MNYINLLTLEFPRYQGDIRLNHPEIGEEFVCPNTYAPVTVLPAPVIDSQNQKTQFGTPYESNGQWVVDLVVVNLTDKEKAVKNVKPSQIEQNPEIKAIMEKIEKDMV
jgi:hypothetical protein